MNRRRRACTFGLMVVCMGGLVVGLARAQMRTWTSATGQTIEAEFVELRRSTVVLRTADGESMTIGLSGLIAADRQYVQQQALLRELPDYSYAGFKASAASVPWTPVRIALSPGTDERRSDTDRINAAIQEVGGMPADVNGMRGAVLLRRGLWRIGESIVMNRSGVVLRGEGDDPEGTILLATGKRGPPVIRLGGDGGATPAEVVGSRRAIRDKLVPLGALSFQVDDPTPFAPGQAVVVARPETPEWLAAIAMNWTAEKGVHRFIRDIVAVNGREIVLDAPITDVLDRRFGSFWISVVAPPGVTMAGIEGLRGISVHANPEDELHPADFILVMDAADCWVRRITAVHFFQHAVHTHRSARRTLVADSSCLDPASKMAGGRRYGFGVKGTQGLFLRCHSTFGRHDFNVHDRVSGPNVFLECTAENSLNVSEPHHRWSTATLYDNVRVDGPFAGIQAVHRGAMHGWTGAWVTMWNCQAPYFGCMSPPLAKNWAIGCERIGRRRHISESFDGWFRRTTDPEQAPARDGRFGDGVWESYGKRVTPDSLFRHQLAQRLGPQALENLVGQEPDIIPPGGHFYRRQVVTLTTPRPDARIRYSLDGSIPDGDETGETYVRPFSIDAETVVTAKAFHPGGTESLPVRVRFMPHPGPLTAAVVPSPPTLPGLAVAHFNRFLDWAKLADAVPDATATVARLEPYWPERASEQFTNVFTGWLRIPQDGAYTFHLAATNGGRVFLHDRMLLESSSFLSEAQAVANLAAGFHPVRIEYFRRSWMMHLKLMLAGPDRPRGEIPADWWWHRP